MSKINVETLVELMESRNNQIPSDEVSSEYKKFIKDFYEIGEELKEKAPERHVKTFYFEEQHILASKISIDDGSVGLHYNTFDEVIDINVEINKNLSTNVDILSLVNSKITSARKKETVTPEDMLNYFEQTDVYRTLVYFKNQ